MKIDIYSHLTVKDLLKFTAPSIAMMIFSSVYYIIDGLFVANFVGTTGLAAVNLIMPFIMILGTVGFMIGTGGTAIVAKTFGEKDPERANRYFSMFIYAALVLGIIFAVAGQFFIIPIATILGASGELLAMCHVYAAISLVSLPFFVLQYVFQEFFVAAGKPNVGFFVVFGAGIINIVLDALFIAGFGWGVAGAAIATAIGEFFGGIVPLVYFARKKASPLRLGKTSFNFRIFGKACVNGSSEMVTNIAMSLVGMLYNYQLMHMIGAEGVAAYGVIMYVVMVFSAIFMGYAMGSAPLMSIQYGAKNHTEMRSLWHKGMGIIGVSGIIMFVAAELLARPISAAFVGYDPALLDMTTHAFMIYSVAYLLMGFSIYGSSFFTALNNGLVSASISFLRTLVFETSAIIILPMIFGIDGIWAAIIVAEFAAVVVTLIFMFALGKTYGYR